MQVDLCRHTCRPVTRPCQFLCLVFKEWQHKWPVLSFASKKQRQLWESLKHWPLVPLPHCTKTVYTTNSWRMHNLESPSFVLSLLLSFFLSFSFISFSETRTAIPPNGETGCACTSRVTYFSLERKLWTQVTPFRFGAFLYSSFSPLSDLGSPLWYHGGMAGVACLCLV